MTSRTSLSRPSVILAAGLVAFYAVFGLVILEPESVYSGDIGVKFVQARALADSGFTSLDIPYRGEFLDPERTFFPLRPPFALIAGGTTQAIFPPVAAVIQAGMVALFGFEGLIALSIVSAGVVLAASWRMTPPQLAAPVLVAMGLGGPLWFYAVIGGEHAPALALSTAAFSIAVSSSRWQRLAFVSGALLGAGAALRDEVICLAPGLLLALWVRHRSRRALAIAVAGVLLPLLLSMALDVLWFGRPPAAHLRHAVHLAQSALPVTTDANVDLPVLRPMTSRERYDTVVTYWLLGRGTPYQVAGFVAALLVALEVRRRWRSSAAILIWLLAFGATAVWDLWEVLTAPKFLAGLVRVSPFVVLALMPSPAAPAGHTHAAPGFRRVVWFATAAYLLIACATVNTTGGKSLGPRLLLPLLPLLTVSAMVTIADYLRAEGAVNRTVGWTGAALVAIAVAIHAGGTIPAYKQRNLDDASAVRAVAASPQRIVVADDMFTAQLLFPLYTRKIILLADTPGLGHYLGKQLAARRLDSALLVSREPRQVVGLRPLRMERSEQQGRMLIQSWRRY
jgi:hypothetical protein